MPFELASIYGRSGLGDDARRAHEAVLRLNQDQPIIRDNLTWLLAVSGDPTDADLVRAMAVTRAAEGTLRDDPRVADTLGWIMLQRNIPPATISLFHEAVIALSDRDALQGTVRYHLAQAYERNGETDRAIAELTRALDSVPGFAERDATMEMLRQLRSS